MLLLLLLFIILLCLYRADYQIKGFNEKYLSKSGTDSIRGIFILLIVVTHSLQYISRNSYNFSSVGDEILMWIVRNLGQLVVVMFLFYSGFGIGESYKRKGMHYLNAFPRKRILTTLLNFDVAIIAFLLLGMYLGTPMTIRQVLLSFVGWESLGNSNWYIFVILLCYLFSYLSIRMNVNSWFRVLILTMLCFVAIVWLSKEKDGCWYNTILCFPMGFLFSTYKNSIERFLKNYYWVSCVCLSLIFMILRHVPTDGMSLSYNALSIVFAMLVVLLTMKVKIGNPFLQWLGGHLFPIYIYMRIPMILIEEYQPRLITNQPAFFVMISLLVTLVIAHYYKNWQIKLV